MKFFPLLLISLLVPLASNAQATAKPPTLTAEDKSSLLRLQLRVANAQAEVQRLVVQVMQAREQMRDAQSELSAAVGSHTAKHPGWMLNDELMFVPTPPTPTPAKKEGAK